MDFESIVSNSCYCLNLRATTKTDVIKEMVGLLVSAGKLRREDEAEILKVILDREQRMTTGIKQGVAMPHGKTPLVDDVIVCVGVKRDGLDFGALDGQPSRLFVLVVSSSLQPGPYMEYLARISKTLNVAVNREGILGASTPGEVIKILST